MYSALVQPGIFQSLALVQVSLGHSAGQFAHATEESLAFRDANGAARIQNIKSMRAFEQVIVGRQHQIVFQSRLRFALEQIVHLAQALHIGDLEVILAVLLFGLQVQLAILYPWVPLNLAEAMHALQGDGNAV